MPNTNTKVTDGNFAVASASAPFTRNRPFEGDANSYEYEEEYTQLMTAWTALPIGFPKSFDGHGCVLFEETPMQHIGCGVGKWLRKFCRTPNRQVLWESFNWRRPGLSPDVSPFKIGILGTPVNSGHTTIITTKTDHNLKAGDNVTVAYNVKFSSNSAETTRYVTLKVIDKPSASKLTVPIITERVSFWHHINAAGGRTPETVTRTSKVEVDFFMTQVPGSLYKTVEEIPIFDQFAIYNVDLDQIDSISATTDPNLTTYKGYIANKTWLTAESSIITPWHRPIYQRATRFVLAE